MTTKIAILGTCASEDWYHFQDPRKRLDVKILPFQPSSLISAMAKPVDMAVEAAPGLKEREVGRLKVDFDKSYLASLVAFQPDVLIVEALADSRRGVIAIGDSWVTRNFRIEKSPMYQQLGAPKAFTPLKQKEAYYPLFRQAAKAFNAFLRETLPHCRVVLSKARWAEYYIDDAGQLVSYPPWTQNEYFVANRRLEELEKIFSEEVACDSVEVETIPVFADSQHIWGSAAEHYIKPYYLEVSERLGKLLATCN